MDFRGEPFDPMPQIMAVSEQVTKLQAVCAVCGSSSSRTQRLIDGQPARIDDPIILVEQMKVMSQDAEHIIL